jgi:hypothetical protein
MPEAVTLSDDQIVVRMTEVALTPEALSDSEVGRVGEGVCVLRLPFHMRRRRGELILSNDTPADAPARMDRALMRAVVLAKAWSRELELVRSRRSRRSPGGRGSATHYTARARLPSRPDRRCAGTFVDVRINRELPTRRPAIAERTVALSQQKQKSA